MPHNIRVIATPHDPVIMNRLVRLLIAQAQIEITKKESLAEANTASARDSNGEEKFS